MHLEQHFPDGLLDRSIEIGAVTDRSVRAWLRWPDRPEVSGALLIDGQEATRASTNLSATTDWTGVLEFELPEPRPGAAFEVRIEGQVREARLAPSPGQKTGLTFGFGSCNCPFKFDGECVNYHLAAGIYEELLDDLQRAGASFMLLAGDQIYSDEIDPISVRATHLDDPDWLPELDDVIEDYRRVSRGYLNVPGFRRIRERFPTLTMWDDHDIFDNWGSRKETSELDMRMFEAATKVYNEYQHARNPGPHKGAPPFHYTYQYGDIGFFVLDIRGKRDWKSGQLLGIDQWNDVVEYLVGSTSEAIRTLFVVSSVPVAHVSRWITEIFEPLPGKFGDSVRDRWSTDSFRAQRDALLEKLLEWETASPGRQVIILSGDVHVASAFTIRPRAGTGKIEQFTSSAFTTPLTSFERYLNVAAARGSNLFEPRWSFERRFIRYSNNAGLVRLTPLDTGGHHVELLIRGWNLIEGKMETIARRSVSPESR